MPLSDGEFKEGPRDSERTLLRPSVAYARQKGRREADFTADPTHLRRQAVLSTALNPSAHICNGQGHVFGG